MRLLCLAALSIRRSPELSADSKTRSVRAPAVIFDRSYDDRVHDGIMDMIDDVFGRSTLLANGAAEVRRRRRWTRIEKQR